MIHYHGLRISGTHRDNVEFARNRHVLVSYMAKDVLELVCSVCSSFCIDNGAFSAWKSGTAVDWEGYAEWVREWHQHPRYDFALIPDVIDGGELDNKKLVLKYRKKFKDAVPIWHLHESLQYLDVLCRTFPRVALGSSGQWATPGTADWWVRINEAMEVACDDRGRPRTRLHGLRMLSTKVFPRLPLASADSCNAGINAGSKGRFGMYMPPKSSQRTTIIASQIESVNSACRWEK